MTCPNQKCKKEAERLIIPPTGGGIFCNGCYKMEPLNNIGSLHKVRLSFWKKGVRLTEADAMRIKTNKKRSDGKYRPDPRWRTSGD